MIWPADLGLHYVAYPSWGEWMKNPVLPFPSDALRLTFDLPEYRKILPPAGGDRNKSLATRSM